MTPPDPSLSNATPTTPGDSLPHPLGLTSDQFIKAYAGRIILDRIGGAPGALLAYRRLFRSANLEGLRQAVPHFETPAVATLLRDQCPEGDVLKFSLRVPGTTLGIPGSLHGTRTFDQLATESVLIPMIGRKRRLTHTLCVSSQVGCAMGCRFCETAQMGLIRHLEPHEIVAQWFAATHAVGIRPANMVFMGMGEPMDNLDNVLQAIDVLKDNNGAGMPISKITISTVGRVDGILRLAEHIHQPGWRRLNLAISLNAPNDEVRSDLMPINRRWNMAELQAALLQFPIYGGGKLCIEYVLIPDVNDLPHHAKEIADFVAPINAHYQHETLRGVPRVMINLIPYNPRRNSPWPAPTEEAVDRFIDLLNAHNVYVKRRRTKGRDLMGACGQLGSAEIRQRKLVQVGLPKP